MNKFAALLLTACLGLPLTATAIPVTYQIKFTALTGRVTTVIYPDPLVPPISVHVEDAAGKVYFGLFSVDDEILVTDGLNKPGNLNFLYIQPSMQSAGHSSVPVQEVAMSAPTGELSKGRWRSSECLSPAR